MDPGPGRLKNIQIHNTDADPYSTFHPDGDPDLDPDPSFQMKAQTIEKLVSFSIHFGLSSAN
jgi:hypothetical protein